MTTADGIFTPPKPINERVKTYAPGSPERLSLEAEVSRQLSEVVEIPCVVGGEAVYTGNTVEVTNPGDHHGDDTACTGPGVVFDGTSVCN